ncbi:BclA C-terminal domain-containing protein [Alkalihalobacillus pseudalcaliphilus]|uniref:BclA C-terminal domain-containing protein n=1 Tax=Alkalihalobacillus pseudalcaliphilus TaxID=79884 RepID=UPI00064D7AC6|nr:hypothetical protein [Alkalihalobacillus pseudalcaliphilus]KMK77315.1 hypothetical protein AB990_07150 [Alkalihalobacillus pseudalcaliphilus]
MNCCSPRYFVNENGFLQTCPRRYRKSFCSVVTPSYLFATNATATLTVTDAVTPVLVPLDENVRMRGFIGSPDFTQLASQNSGIYNSSYSITLTSATPQTVNVAVYVNGEPLAGTERTVTLAANVPATVSLTNFPIDLFSGQIVSLGLVGGAASTITATNASLSLNRIANPSGPTPI